MKTLVIGDSRVYRYITLGNPKEDLYLGGAAGLAMILKGLGHSVHLITWRGDDAYGEHMRNMFVGSGISRSFHIGKNPTHEELVRVDYDGSMQRSDSAVAAQIENDVSIHEGYDVVVVVDNAKGGMTGNMINKILHGSSPVVVLAYKDLARYKGANVLLTDDRVKETDYYEHTNKTVVMCTSGGLMMMGPTKPSGMVEPENACQVVTEIMKMTPTMDASGITISVLAAMSFIDRPVIDRCKLAVGFVNQQLKTRGVGMLSMPKPEPKDESIKSVQDMEKVLCAFHGFDESGPLKEPNRFNMEIVDAAGVKTYLHASAMPQVIESDYQIVAERFNRLIVPNQDDKVLCMGLFGPQDAKFLKFAKTFGKKLIVAIPSGDWFQRRRESLLDFRFVDNVVSYHPGIQNSLQVIENIKPNTIVSANIMGMILGEFAVPRVISVRKIN